jgi:hypothetical protein
MEWEAVGAVAEFVGALGVIASLAYLAHQIRIGTRTERARALQDLLNQNLALNTQISGESDLFARAFEGESFTGAEAVRWMAMQNIGFRFQWRAIASPMQRIFELPAMRQYWEQAFALYPAGFRAAIETLIAPDSGR